MIDRLTGNSLALQGLLFLHFEVGRGKLANCVKKFKTLSACKGAENQ